MHPDIFQMFRNGGNVTPTPSIVWSSQLAVLKYRTGEPALQEAKSTKAEQEAHLTDMLRQKELPPKREQHVLQVSIISARGGTGSGLIGLSSYLTMPPPLTHRSI